MNLTPPVKSRIQSIDILRGIVMIIMALDHVRDFFHEGAFASDPLDPATTNAPLYFTRWITHFCAPVFVFLAGTSGYLQGLKKSKGELSKFLITRGLWLIVVEWVIISLALTFNPAYNMIPFQVIWAIGISMVVLGIVVWLPYPVIFALGALIVLGHNSLDYVEQANAKAGQPNGFWLDILHAARFSFYPFAEGHNIVIVYPFLAWAGIMMLGYCLGRLFEATVDPARRRKILLAIGFGLIAFFIAIRWANSYGDPNPWRDFPSALRDFFSFMNVTKYPPSVMYASITLGPALIVLALLEGVQNKVTEFAKVFGRVPFFYYVVHFYLIHTLTVIAFFASGYGTKDIVDPNSFFFFRPVQFGFPLWAVYIVWISVILILYPLCKRYNQYKSTHKHWWLSYI
jgi:uncharacterized membrane protein